MAVRLRRRGIARGSDSVVAAAAPAARPAAPVRAAVMPPQSP